MKTGPFRPCLFDRTCEALQTGVGRPLLPQPAEISDRQPIGFDMVGRIVRLVKRLLTDFHRHGALQLVVFRKGTRLGGVVGHLPHAQLIGIEGTS